MSDAEKCIQCRAVLLYCSLMQQISLFFLILEFESSWICHYHGCHQSIQFYSDPFIKLDLSSSWLPLFSSIL
jgi:hypothetical protein